MAKQHTHASMPVLSPFSGKFIYCIRLLTAELDNLKQLLAEMRPSSFTCSLFSKTQLMRMLGLCKLHCRKNHHCLVSCTMSSKKTRWKQIAASNMDYSWTCSGRYIVMSHWGVYINDYTHYACYVRDII